MRFFSTGGVKEKSRNHPADPVGGPDPPCVTLTAISFIFRLKAENGLVSAPFHILPFLTAAHLRRHVANGSGTFCPFDMVERYEYDTHFESGIGVGIRGYMKEGPVTIFKMAGDLSRYFVAEGALVRNQAKPDLCRTQQVIQLSDKSQTAYFMKNPIGNHHIIMPGHQRDLIEGLLNSFGL